MKPLTVYARNCKMQNHYEVNVTPYALNQLQETAQYISGVLQSSENATHWLDTLEDALASLSFMPSRIPLTEEEPWHSQGVHKMIVKNFLAYFWIDEINMRVWVTAVVYGRQKQRQQLERMSLPWDDKSNDVVY